MQTSRFLIALCLSALCLSFLPSKAWADDIDPLAEVLRERWETNEDSSIQSHKTFESERRFEFSVQLGYIPNDDFYHYFPIDLRAAYHFTPSWGVELQTSLLHLKTPTTLHRFLLDKGPETLAMPTIADEQLFRMHVAAVYHPLYGKWAFSGTSLGAFDWGVYAGLGLVVHRAFAHSRQTLETQFDAVLGTHFHFFILDFMALRADFSLNLYPDAHGVQLPCAISLGLSFYLPSLP